MKIAVIGSGYVGLVAGAGFSDFGNHVTCVDIDPSRIERLRRGEIPFHEPGLSDLVQRNARQVGRALTGFTVVVNKSTVPVGTGDLVKKTIAEVTTQPFTVASNPEFLKEGDAINDFLKPA